MSPERDTSTGLRSRIVHSLADVIRARIFAIACGYEDGNDLGTPLPLIHSHALALARGDGRPIQRPSNGKSLPIAVGGSVAEISGTALITAATKVFEFGPGQTR
jgi:hypothetical protein